MTDTDFSLAYSDHLPSKILSGHTSDNVAAGSAVLPVMVENNDNKEMLKAPEAAVPPVVMENNVRNKMPWAPEAAVLPNVAENNEKKKMLQALEAAVLPNVAENNENKKMLQAPEAAVLPDEVENNGNNRMPWAPEAAAPPDEVENNDNNRMPLFDIPVWTRCKGAPEAAALTDEVESNDNNRMPWAPETAALSDEVETNDNNRMPWAPEAAALPDEVETNDNNGMPWAPEAAVLPNEVENDEHKKMLLPLPKIISVTFTKKAAKTKLGMILKQGEHGEVYVSELKDVGMLHQSPVSIGDQLLLINRVPCTNMDKDTAVDILRNATGRVTIVFHNQNGMDGCVVSMVEKSTEENVGLIFENDGIESLTISGIETSGPYVDSLLAVHDSVIAINGIRCDGIMSSETAEDIIHNALRFVTIQAQKPPRKII